MYWPQSTGRFTIGVHIFADFCFGLFGRQLLLSSNTTSDLAPCMHSSASPLKKLYENVRLTRLGSRQRFFGTTPVRILCEKSNSSTLVNPAKLLGSTPTNEFQLASNTVALPSDPISHGKQPTSPLFIKIISLRVATILPTLVGMHPPSLLLARTMTEAVELPKFSGMWEVKRLSLRKMASSSLSKSSNGREPSKSLNLRSRYLRLGRPMTTMGKDPTKRLLLTSSSWSRVRREKLLGMMPQKRLELIWKMAMSVRRPSSTGR